MGSGLWRTRGNLVCVKALSSSLEADQRGVRRLPHVEATVLQQRFRAPVLPFDLIHEANGEHHPTAATITDTGALLTAFNDNGTIRVRRTTDPSPNSDFDTFLNAAGFTDSGVGIALGGFPGVVFLMYAAGPALNVRVSVNDGVSWGAEATLVTEGDDIDDVALAFAAEDEGCAFYLVNGDLKRLRYSSGWAGSGTSWTHGAMVDSLNGVGVTYDADYRLAITGVDDDGQPTTWASTMFDVNPVPNLFTTPQVVAVSDADATTSYHAPSILQVAFETRIFFTVTESGNVAGSRVHWSHHPPASDHLSINWSEPAPFDSDSAHGVAVLENDGDVYVFDGEAVYHATHQTAPLADLTAQLVRMTYDLGQYHAKLEATFSDPANVATFTAATDLTGFTLRIRPGYVSNDGDPEFGVALHFAIDRHTYTVDDKGRRTLTIHGTGQWEQLARWRAPAAWQVAATTSSRGALFQRVGALAAIDITSGGGGTAWTTFQPAFTVAPGESGAVAASRLLAVAGEEAIDDAGLFTVLTTSDVSQEDYGPGDHPFTELQLTASTPPANWVRVTGPDRRADSHDFSSIHRRGPALAPVRNLDANSDEKAEAYAAAALARRLRDRAAGQLTAPLHSGLQLFDVITVTDDPLSATAMPLRVTNIRATFDRRPNRQPLYTHTLALSPV